MDAELKVLRARVAALEKTLAERDDRIDGLEADPTFYRAVVETQTEFITRFLPDGTITFVNDAVCRLARRSREELLGQSFFPFLPAEDHERWVRAFASLTPERPSFSIEHRIITEEVRWAHWSNRALFDDQGRLVALQGVGHDVTERKRTEEVLEKRNAELGLANRELQRLQRTRDELIAMVSHELRTPLVTGLGYIEMLISGAYGQISEKALAKMQIAHKNLRRLSILIERMIDYRNLLGATFIGEVKLGPFNIRALAQEALSDFMVRTGMGQERTSLTAEQDLPRAVGDAESIRIVLSNLLNNAASHAGEGARVALRIQHAPDRGRIVVSVEDDGVGFPAQVLEHAFEPLAKRDDTASGLGLGLAIVHRIVTAHKSEVTISSREGQGTAVSFWLLAAGQDDR